MGSISLQNSLAATVFTSGVLLASGATFKIIVGVAKFLGKTQVETGAVYLAGKVSAYGLDRTHLSPNQKLVIANVAMLANSLFFRISGASTVASMCVFSLQVLLDDPFCKLGGVIDLFGEGLSFLRSRVSPPARGPNGE